MKRITNQQLNLPRHAPVMVLPNALLFPNSLLPLFIFEPRYRAMLKWSLEQHRMFCIALIKRGVTDWSSTADFHHVAGLGLVRACVGRDDGTSHLMLQGLSRVEFTGFVQEEPFVIAELRELPTTGLKDEQTEALSATVLELCAEYRAQGAKVPDTIDQLAQVENAGVLADLVAHTLLHDPYHRQSVLEAIDVPLRLRRLIQHLRAEMV